MSHRKERFGSKSQFAKNVESRYSNHSKLLLKIIRSNDNRTEEASVHFSQIVLSPYKR